MKKKQKKGFNRHIARCPRCKINIYQLLSRLYGLVEQGYQLKIATVPGDYIETRYYEALKKIYQALQQYRGHNNFVGTPSLPACDFFVPEPGFIVEFDERQHFSRAREIALGLYPDTLNLGFNRLKWIELCRKIGAHDNDPEYRDEQRAWYDTLRDFAPAILDLKPTVRLYDEDRIWCAINPDNSADRNYFERILRQERGSPHITVKGMDNPFFARVVISNLWRGTLSEARKLLEGVCAAWPEGTRARFLLTCGGFIQFGWPTELTRNEVGNNLNPNVDALAKLFNIASHNVAQVIEGGLREKMARYVEYLTLGVDSSKEKISTTGTAISKLHCELVYVIRLRDGEIHWTGKSYPTTSQQGGLVRIADLKSHFVNLPQIGKTMILGCHDLAIYSPRSINAKGWRKELNAAFRKIAFDERPEIVLHHPHTADAVMTWRPMWKFLKRNLPSVKLFAGAGRYYNKQQSPRSPLNKVLQACLRGNSIDFIVEGSTEQD